MLNLVGCQSQQTGSQIELRLLEAEVSELRAALDATDLVGVLDEVVDVLYRARSVAVEVGITVEMLDEYAYLKNKLRTSTGKDKRLEEYLARGVISSYKG